MVGINLIYIRKFDSIRMVYIASDHAGFGLKGEIKDFLKKSGYKVEDLGPFKYVKTDDYPDYAEKLAKKVSETKKKGILICGSAHGMNIAANKVPGVYATICWNQLAAKYARSHNETNVLCLPARLIGSELAKKVVETWLETDFEGAERHRRRISKVKEIGPKK